MEYLHSMVFDDYWGMRQIRTDLISKFRRIKGKGEHIPATDKDSLRARWRVRMYAAQYHEREKDRGSKRYTSTQIRKRAYMRRLSAEDMLIAKGYCNPRASRASNARGSGPDSRRRRQQRARRRDAAVMEKERKRQRDLRRAARSTRNFCLDVLAGYSKQRLEEVW